MIIDATTHYKTSESHYEVEHEKTQIVIGRSLRKKSYHITRLQQQEFGRSKKWNTYSITRSGEIYQHYDDKFYSDFLDIKDADVKSISIVLENMGSLFETKTGEYINWLTEMCDPALVVENNWRGYRYWEKFTDNQMKSVSELCLYLCKKHNIPNICIDFDHYHKDIINFKGIVFRSNYLENSSDVNPNFDIESFNKSLYIIDENNNEKE